MDDGSPGYALEKLSAAVHILATGTGDVRDRLGHAFISFHPVQERDFPEPLREEWRWVKSQLTRFGPLYGPEGKVSVGSVEHTLSRIKNSTGAKIAAKIVHLQEELECYLRKDR